MAGNNKIGIQVQVEFPTVTELKNNLAEKWKMVKNGFEAKINVGVDGTSMNKLKKAIQTALDTDAFQVKIDNKLALGEIGEIQKQLVVLDKKLDKVREIKIGFNLSDMDKSMKEIIALNQKAENSADKLNDKTKEQTTDLNKQVDAYDKIVRKFKLIDGKRINTHVKTTYTDEKGKEMTRNVNLKSGDVTEQDSYNKTKIRLELLKEVQDVMKNIHKLEMDQMGASADHSKIISAQLNQEKSVLETLKDQYSQKYKNFAIQEDSSKELVSQQNIAKAIKEQLDFEKLLSTEQKEQAQSVQKLVSLEQQIHSLKMKQITALEDEQASLQEQVRHYEGIQSAIRDTLTGSHSLTAEQVEQITNLKTINSLEQSRATDKKAQQAMDAKSAQDQKEAFRQITSNLQEIHRLKMAIAQIEERRNAGGTFGTQEQLELKALKDTLDYKKRNADEDHRILALQGLITQSMHGQLDAQRSINAVEMSRVGNGAKVKAEQDKIVSSISKQESAYQSLLQVEQNVLKLQRDLIFAGMREQTVIEKAIGLEREKGDAIQEQLRIANALTAERQQEINKIRTASKEQLELNKRRQDAREKDQSFNDTGGLIDPMQTYQNGRQAFDAILEPMKEIDEAFFKVAKVADTTDSALQNFKDSAFDVGTSLGTSASEYMMAVETWVTAGKTFEESQELGQTSQIGSFVGNIAPDDMVKYMAVPMNAFEEQGLEAVDVINVMNETANNHAIEMDHLGKAYLRSAATMASAGVTFEELTGLITGAQEATRIGGERIGTALKTVGINYSMIQSQTTADQKKKFNFFDSIGLNLEETDGLYDALGKLKGLWGDLSDEDKTTAIYNLAGKEHSNIVNAIVKEWDTVEKSIADAKHQMRMGKDGSAYVEFAKQSDSLRFKLAELKNMWDKLMVSMGESDGAMSGVLDSLISGLRKLGNLAENPAVMNLVKAIVGLIAMRAGMNGIKRLWDTLSTGFDGTKKDLTEVAVAWGLVKKKVNEASLAVGAFNTITPDIPIVPIVGSTGGVVKKGSKTDEKDGGAGGKDGSNGSGGGVLIGGLGSGKTTPKVDQKDIENTEKLAKASGGVTKALGKSLMLVPLLGDALVLMEIMGVPIFDTIGKGLGTMFKNTEDNIGATQKLIDKFKGSNLLINGELDAHRNKIDNLEADAEEAGIINENDKTGELTRGKMNHIKDPEVFKKFQADFNAEAEALGLKDELGVPIRVTMNDTTQILDALKALNAEKDKLSKAEVMKVGEQIHKETTGLETTFTDASKVKGRMNGNQDAVNDAQIAVNKLTEADGSVSKENRAEYEMWSSVLKTHTEKLVADKKELANLESAIEKQRKSIGDNSRALMSEGKGYDASTLSKEEALSVTKGMVREYGSMKDESHLLAGAQKALADGTKLTDEQFQYLSENFDEVAGNGKEVIEANGELNTTLRKVTKEEQNKQRATLEGAKSAMRSAGEQAGAQELVQEAINSTTGEVKKTGDEAIRTMADFDKLDGKIEDLPAEKTFTMKIEETGMHLMTAVKDFFGGGKTKDFVINVAKKMTTEKILPKVLPMVGNFLNIGKYRNESNSVGTPQVGTTRTTSSGRSSSSVATGATVRGAGKIVNSAKATAKKASDKKEVKEVNNSRVSEDVWRYWNTEGKQSNLEATMRDLERAITDAKDDYTKVVSALTKQLTNLKSQQINQKTLLSQKDSEMNSTLAKLKAYGFKVNSSTNTISNLGQARNLKGEGAEKADTLLQTWKSLSNELISINDKFKDINSQIKATQEEIKQAKIAQEAKKFDAQLKRISAVTTSVANRDSLMSTKASQIGSEDKELNLKVNRDGLIGAQANMTSLLKEFNALSTATVNNKENGELLKGTLDSLGQQMLVQADNVIKYKQAINDLQFARINEDMQEFNATLDEQVGKMQNNSENLKEGLLSGTDLSDLQSSKGSVIDLSRDNEYEKSAQARIDLEKEVQDALNGYAKKNVDRVKGVATATLQVNTAMFNELLKMQATNASGKKVITNTKLLDKYYGDLEPIASLDQEYAKTAKYLEKYYKDVQAKEEALKKKYNSDMAKASTPNQKQAVDDRFILDSLAIERQYHEAQIKANNEAIKDLNSQLADSSEADKKKIRTQIATYEKDNIDTQNLIKATIKARFDFEFSLMNKAIQKSNDAKSALQDTLDLLSSLGTGNHDGKGTLLDAMLGVEKGRNTDIKKNIASLRSQLKLYQAGSFEWNIINDQVSQYNSQLGESNKQLIDMNKNIMANSFSATTHDLERKLFGGKSHDAWQQHQQLWMEGLEKEIALEKMYKRMADLGTTVNKEKLDLLSQQEKLSKFEMDHLNKQIDLIELQQKVDNLEKEKTIQILKQNEFGQWDWSYEADATQLEKAKDDLAQSQLDLQKMEDKGREDYLQQLNKILADAQTGQFETVDAFKKAMQELASAFDTAVGDIPEVSDSYIDELVEAYSKFIRESAGVVANNPADAYLVQATQTMTDSLKKTFTDISASLGEVFANALLAKLPSTSVNANRSVASGSTAVTIEKVEFPNATNKNEIQDAILSLPQLALQKTKSPV